MTDHPPRHALREPMVWLVVGLPLVVVIAAFITLYLSIRSGGNDAVLDNVQRTAQIQTTDLSLDEAARGLHLSAVASVLAGRVRVLPVSGTFDRDKPLTLLLAHPLAAAQDITLTLQPEAAGWSAPVQLDTRHRWNLTLTPADGRWRLRGRIERGEHAGHLAPALPAK